jgi:hypothetical protein
VLLLRLEELPAPAVSLSRRAVGLGQRAAAHGAESLLEVLPVDAASRVPSAARC